MFKKKEKSPSGSNLVTNPYIAARQEWNERYGDFISRERNWQIIATISMGIAALSVAGIAWIGSQSKIVPYIVEVDKLGSAVAVGIAEKAAQPDDRIIRNQLANWIVNVRSVYLDDAAEKIAVNSAYSFVQSNSIAFQTIADYHRANNPFTRAKTEGVSVEVQTVLPVTKDTYKIEWKETVRNRDGHTTTDTIYQAMVSILIQPPTDAAKALQNPTGIIINNLSWSNKQG